MDEKARADCPRTDLACERMRADTETAGVEYREEEGEGCRISRLTVTSDEGAEAIGKPKGTYVTMSFPPLWEIDDGALLGLSRTLSALIGEFCRAAVSAVSSVLVVGLGNRYLTSDAIGPESVREMIATRHIKAEDPALFSRYADVEISLLAPGVLAQTGIEAQCLVAGASEAVSPDLVIAIDALAARSVSRLATTVQLSDTGIRPGSGIGNARRALDRETLGVPVIAIGIPTVVDSTTLVLDAFQRAGLSDGEIPEPLREVLSEGATFFVSPRQSDVLTEKAARLISDAVNLTFSAGLFGEK
ncbi:MAG: GPR endopeptidase [Clostridia bacterium]|nr:GPR endopeptidase [Clostridia bacterium]